MTCRYQEFACECKFMQCCINKNSPLICFQKLILSYLPQSDKPRELHNHVCVQISSFVIRVCLPCLKRSFLHLNLLSKRDHNCSSDGEDYYVFNGDFAPTKASLWLPVKMVITMAAGEMKRKTKTISCPPFWNVFFNLILTQVKTFLFTGVPVEIRM